MENFPQDTKDIQKPKPEKICYHTHHDDRDQDQEEDNEEALSLRDLPLNTATKPSTSIATANTADHQDPSAAAEFFEFLSSTSHDISPAEDIIFRGKLIPLNDQNAFRGGPFSSPAGISGDKGSVGRNATPRVRSRSGSLSAIQGDKLGRSGSVTRGNSDIKLTRNSRSLDYRKLTRVSSIVNSSSSPDPDCKLADRTSPEKRSDTASFGVKILRPRWYMMMFGMVKFPPEIELRDMKSRQSRRSIPPAMFPSSSSDRISGERSSQSPSSSSLSSSPSSSWKLLKALSCKEPTSVAVTAPFWVPHAR